MRRLRPFPLLHEVRRVHLVLVAISYVSTAVVRSLAIVACYSVLYAYHAHRTRYTERLKLKLPAIRLGFIFFFVCLLVTDVVLLMLGTALFDHHPRHVFCVNKE